MKRVVIVFFLLVINLKASKNLDLKNYCTKIRLFNDMEIALYTPSMFRIRFSELEGEKFPSKYEIPFVIGKLESWPENKAEKSEDNESIFIKTKKLIIKISKSSKKWQVWLPDKSKRIYPSQGPVFGMFKDGYTVFDNVSAFNQTNNNSRYSHWFYSPETGNYTDTFLSEELIWDTYFIYGPDYPSLFEQIKELVGPEPLLPKKAYGFFQTQHLACEGSQVKLMKVARMFRERDIPCDTIIIDFEWGDGCDGEKEVKWGSRLDWSPSYVKPLTTEEMIKTLHKMNYQVMLIHHSAPDFTNRNHQGWTESLYSDDVWWKKFKEKLDVGVDGTWQDTRRNDITDSVIWQGIQKYIQGTRRVLFMGCRKMQAINPWDKYYTAWPVNSLMGSRRYPFDWTGDCSYSWNELAWQIKSITNTHGSMKGVSYITSDAIGANWKIQARWNQFADFSSISRSHNAKPWSGNIHIEDFANKIRISGREDMKKGKSGQDTDSGIKETAENSIRKHRKLRYRLLPYLYSYAYVNYLKGMPICRPMVLAFPYDFRCNSDQWPYQYMLGKEILVAPVYGDFDTMEIYLPEGSWIDFWSKDMYKGGGILRYDVKDIEKLPLFIRAGSIIPMRKECNWIDPSVPDDPLFLNIYPIPEKSSSFTYYEDDGFTTAYQQREFGETIFTLKKPQKNSWQIQIGKMMGNYSGKLAGRKLIIKFFLQKTKPEEVFIEKKKIVNTSSREKDLHNYWYYRDKDQFIYINIQISTNRETNIRITK